MRHFDEIHTIAINRKGGEKALEKLIRKPKTAAALRRIPDDRWLSAMTKNVFRAGFVWRVVDLKWPDFERVFAGFDLHAVAYLSDDAIDALLEDASIIRHHKKLLAARENAVFLLEIADEHGSAGAYFANYPRENFADLLDDLKKRASRMGGTSAQYFLREMGKDSFILSRDVTAALIREKVVDKPPASRRDRQAVQNAFNVWCEQSGRSLTEVSRILSMSIES